MDRTAWIVVTACVIGMFFYGTWYSKETQKELAAAAAQRAAEAVARGETEAPALASGEPANAAAADAKVGAADGQTAVDPAAEAEEKIEEQSFVLDNDFIRCHLTNLGAGIAEVELLDHKRSLVGDDGYVTLNAGQKTPIGALSSGPGVIDTAAWTVRSHNDREVVFLRDGADGLRIQKRYYLPEPPAAGEAEKAEEDADDAAGYDPHLVRLQVTIRNISDASLTVNQKYLYAGAAAPLHVREWSREIGYFYKSTGDSMEFESVDTFRKGMFRKERSSDVVQVPQLEWAGINDQFYAVLMRAENPADASVWASRSSVVIPGDEELSKKKKLQAIHAAVGLPEVPLNVDDQHTFDYEIYLGGKEFSRLQHIGQGRKAIMHYDELPIIGWLFGWAIRPLAALLILSLEWMHHFVPYGVAIILTTILIRLIIWPLYAKSTRTMKRMSKLTPKMKEIKEQYKDDPQKQNQEIMGLYKKYGVNPLGGCLPMFVQMPIFLGFYRMLSSAVELRHEGFLWIDDLSMPDTLFMIPGLDIPFNLLPLLMSVTMLIQMKVAPQSGDATQRMIFMLMPVVFLVICYNFASALSLYWTTTNIFSIFQTLLMNKLPEPELKARKQPPGGGGPGNGGGGGGGKKGFLQRLQEQAEAQQKAKRNQVSGDRGDRHTQSKTKKRKKR